MITRFLPLLVLVILFSSGCSLHKNTENGYDPQSIQAIAEESNRLGWWSVNFVKQWPEDSEAPFAYDPLLANEIIRPTLQRFREQIKIWRFHRRAARDPGGSRFRFVFYTTIDDAKNISESLLAHPRLKEMTDSGLIEKIIVDNLTEISKPRVRDTTDRSWPGEIQDSWPYFIMGVSQSWLSLIDAISQSQPVDRDNMPVGELVVYYQEISRKINHHWQKSGGHAYFHHLNALFGYRPIEVRF